MEPDTTPLESDLRRGDRVYLRPTSDDPTQWRESVITGIAEVNDGGQDTPKLLYAIDRSQSLNYRRKDLATHQEYINAIADKIAALQALVADARSATPES